LDLKTYLGLFLLFFLLLGRALFGIKPWLLKLKKGYLFFFPLLASKPLIFFLLANFGPLKFIGNF